MVSVVGLMYVNVVGIVLYYIVAVVKSIYWLVSIDISRYVGIDWVNIVLVLRVKSSIAFYEYALVLVHLIADIDSVPSLYSIGNDLHVDTNSLMVYILTHTLSVGLNESLFNAFNTLISNYLVVQSSHNPNDVLQSYVI